MSEQIFAIELEWIRAPLFCDLRHGNAIALRFSRRPYRALASRIDIGKREATCAHSLAMNIRK
jgi:hypothetical protein